jgi:hypothetical protein
MGSPPAWCLGVELANPHRNKQHATKRHTGTQTWVYAVSTLLKMELDNEKPDILHW